VDGKVSIINSMKSGFQSFSNSAHGMVELLERIRRLPHQLNPCRICGTHYTKLLQDARSEVDTRIVVVGDGNETPLVAFADLIHRHLFPNSYVGHMDISGRLYGPGTVGSDQLTSVIWMQPAKANKYAVSVSNSQKYEQIKKHLQSPTSGNSETSSPSVTQRNDLSIKYVILAPNSLSYRHIREYIRTCRNLRPDLPPKKRAPV
jgi:hypothetical protein